MRVVHRSPRLKLSNCVRHNISLSSSSPLWPAALCRLLSPVQWSICSIGPGPRQLFATIILNLKWPPQRASAGVREGEMKMKTLQTPSPASLSSLSLSVSDLLQSRAVAGWKLQPNPLSIKQMPAMFVLDMQHNPRWRRSTPARTSTVHWD